MSAVSVPSNTSIRPHSTCSFTCGPLLARWMISIVRFMDRLIGSRLSADTLARHEHGPPVCLVCVVFVTQDGRRDVFR